MKPQVRYLKFVIWDEDDEVFVGYCPDLFPHGGVCHGASEEETYRELCQLVVEEIQDLVESGRSLSPPATRPMRDSVPV